MPLSFEVIPVLDILDGVVVQGVAGDRSRYQPIESRLSKSVDALDLALATRDQLGLDHLYLADLDSILHQRPNFDLMERLVQAGFRLLVDSGIRESAHLEKLMSLGVADVILALETIPGPELVGEATARYPSDRLVFSVDQKGGQLMGDLSHWDLPAPTAEWVARTVIELGIGRLVILELAGVGMSGGVATVGLCRDLARLYPRAELITGGGVRSVEDLERLRDAGVSGVLVSTALQNGQLTRADIERVVHH